MGDWALTTWDNLIASLQGAWKVEHTDDDQHGHVHAQSLQVGRVSFSAIITTAQTGQINNFNDAGLRDAGMLRLGVDGSIISLTGIQVPLDELGNVLDGRVLVIENISGTGYVALENQSTFSSPANRLVVPMGPGEATGLTSRYFCKPSTLTLLVYNAKRARWIIEARTQYEIEAYVEIGASVNDYSPTGWRVNHTLKLVPTAANLTISGFSATDFYAPDVRTIINQGVYRIAILHMNTGSTAANRVACPGGTMYYLNPREKVELYRDTAAQWYIKEKADQWIDVAYAAGNFTAATGNWTVDSGDQVTYSYQIDGNKMTVAFEIHATDVSATPNYLEILVPAGRTIARTTRNPTVVIDAGAAAALAQVYAGAGQTKLWCYVNVGGATNWTTTAADNTYVLGQITFMVETSCATVAEAHQDVAHVDTAHADGGHTDVAHTDVVHSDSHSDVAHADVGHSDVVHDDVAHVDIAFVDIAHEDVAHVDGAHADSHDDVAFVDIHDDTAHGDDHTDFDDTGFHNDDHTDSAHVDQHTDIAHVDTHTDAAHGDSHTDVAHSDTAHSDSHTDVAHSDSAHSDTAFSDSHSDTPHDDVAHVDVAHSDTPHVDTIHTDVGLHCDTSHSDIAMFITCGLGMMMHNLWHVTSSCWA